MTANEALEIVKTMSPPEVPDERQRMAVKTLSMFIEKVEIAEMAQADQEAAEIARATRQTLAIGL